MIPRFLCAHPIKLLSISLARFGLRSSLSLPFDSESEDPVRSRTESPALAARSLSLSLSFSLLAIVSLSPVSLFLFFSLRLSFFDTSSSDGLSSGRFYFFATPQRALGSDLARKSNFASAFLPLPRCFFFVLRVARSVDARRTDRRSEIRSRVRKARCATLRAH